MSIKLTFTLVMILLISACNNSSKDDKSTPTLETNNTQIPTPTAETNNTQIPTIDVSSKKHISLTIGMKQKLLLSSNQKVKWTSTNDTIKIDNNGIIHTINNISYQNAQAIITATPENGDTPIDINVTLVPWKSNLSSLKKEELELSISQLLTEKESTIYYTLGSKVSSSNDSLISKQDIGEFITDNYDGGKTLYTIDTDKWHYIRMNNEIYKTDDFSEYNETLTSQTQEHATKLGGLKSAFAYDTKNKYLYAGEYSVDNNNTHSVYQGLTNDTGISEWKEILKFDSRAQDTIHTVRHIHVVAVDPYTEDVWISTGDTNRESRLYYSADKGENFKLFAIGSQYYRSLAIWFTKDYIYWGTDSASVKQVISRVKREKLKENILTPKLSSGKTKKGITYYILKSDNGYFPKNIGRIYKETSPRSLSEENSVYAIDDPFYDYREIVADLANSAQWYHLVVKNDKNEEIVLLSTAAETSEDFSRDHRPRVFGIKEKKDTSVDVQELLSLENNDMKRYSQLIPYFQDKKGFIYFKGRDTEKSVYKTKLYWTDQ